MCVCVCVCDMCVCVCVICVCVCVICVCVCQLREALDAREAVLLAEVCGAYDTLQHTLDDRVLCCVMLCHIGPHDASQRGSGTSVHKCP